MIDGYPNDEQRDIIEHIGGAALVLAPAGSGKTRVMASRLATAVQRGVAAERTLCVTFTNRAAEEMRRRVEEEVGRIGRRCRVTTFHGLCALILRSEADHLGLARDFVIYDEEDSKDLLRELGAERRDRSVGDLCFALAAAKTDAPDRLLTPGRPSGLFPPDSDAAEKRIIDQYHQHLDHRQALDFADLVFRVRGVFAASPVIRDRWAKRFDWIQVDEVQDTHHSEYEVISTLAGRTRELAIFGDTDQTIYGWRGSCPDEVLARFENDFAPVKQFFLTENHRATKRLLEAADRVAATFEIRRTTLEPSRDLPAGEPVRIIEYEDSYEESAAIARMVPGLVRGSGGRRLGILARSHRRITEISRAMTAANVPHVTVEAFEFFRRREVKDALARLRFLINPSDWGSLHRVLIRPASGIGEKTIRDAARDADGTGMRVTDLARQTANESGDPFKKLIKAAHERRMVVMDVETTGLDPATDEVVEVAAMRTGLEQSDDWFHRYLRPTKPVGESEAVHGYSDEFLATKGEDPATVFRELRDFCRGGHVVGHNVRFDLGMIREHARRSGFEFAVGAVDDTLDLARRFLNTDRYDLASLADELNLYFKPDHTAKADVRTTHYLVFWIVANLIDTFEKREAWFSSYAPRFAPVAEQFSRWNDLADRTRPAWLLERILDESGLAEQSAKEPIRAGNLERLVELFRDRDDRHESPRIALSRIVRTCSLMKNVDLLGAEAREVPVITVHQAKGLEFDTVFLAGVTEDEFPNYFARRDGGIEEERRLFYVAVTRAKRRLVVTCHTKDDWGRRKGASEFLRALADPGTRRR